jgi:hypothetical protein
VLFGIFSSSHIVCTYDSMESKSERHCTFSTTGIISMISRTKRMLLLATVCVCLLIYAELEKEPREKRYENVHAYLFMTPLSSLS